MRSKVSVAATALGVIHTGVGFTEFEAFNTYSLLKIGVSTSNVRVRLYADIDSRNADTGRAVGAAHSTSIHLIRDEFIGESKEIQIDRLNNNLKRSNDTNDKSSISLRVHYFISACVPLSSH